MIKKMLSLSLLVLLSPHAPVQAEGLNPTDTLKALCGFVLLTAPAYWARARFGAMLKDMERNLKTGKCQPTTFGEDVQNIVVTATCVNGGLLVADCFGANTAQYIPAVCTSAVTIGTAHLGLKYGFNQKNLKLRHMVGTGIFMGAARAGWDKLDIPHFSFTAPSVSPYSGIDQILRS